MRRNLILTGPQLRGALDELIRSPESLVLGPAGRQRLRGEERILVRRLDAMPLWAARSWGSRWRDMAVVARLDGGSPRARCRALAADLGLSDYHRAAFLLLDVEADPGRASGACVQGGRWARLDAIAAAGTLLQRMDLTSPARPPEPEASPGERWSRVAGALTSEVWRRARECRIAVVGSGRSGSLALEILARQGAGSVMYIVDADTLEEGNLDATFGVSEADIGRPKAEAVADRVRSLRPDVSVVVARERAESPHGISLLRTADLIVTTVDRDAPRLAAALVASAYLRVHLDIGTGVFRRGGRRQLGADVRLLLPGEGCVRCVGGLRREDEARREFLAPSEGRSRREGGDWRTQRAGSLATVNAAAVGCGLQLWLDCLAGRVRSSRWIRLEWDEDGHLRTDDAAVTPAADCTVCSSPGLGDYRFGVSATEPGP